MNGDEEERLLYRLDERTKRIEKAHMQRLENIEDDVQQNSNAIEKLQLKVTRNSTFIGGIGAAVTALLLWAADKVTRIIHL